MSDDLLYATTPEGVVICLYESEAVWMYCSFLKVLRHEADAAGAERDHETR